MRAQERWARTSLMDLPVTPYHRDVAARTDLVTKAFVGERMACKTSRELRLFVKKWRAMWLLHPGSRMKNAPKDSYVGQANQPLVLEEKLLLTGSYDGKKVLRALAHKDGEPLDLDEKNVRIAGHVALPRPALNAFLLAQRYGVASDLGFVRLYLDTYLGKNHLLREGGEREEEP